MLVCLMVSSTMMAARTRRGSSMVVDPMHKAVCYSSSTLCWASNIAQLGPKQQIPPSRKLSQAYHRNQGTVLSTRCVSICPVRTENSCRLSNQLPISENLSSTTEERGI